MPFLGLGVGIGRQRFGGGGIFAAYAARVAAAGGTTEAGACVDAVTGISLNASLLLVPSGYKSGVVYSEIPTDGSGDLTFTRASTATRVNSSGNIESVSTGVPRLDYSSGGCPSLLLEPQRTNLATYSEQFDNWNKTNVSVTANATTSPSGYISGDLLTDNATNSNHFIDISVSTSSSTTYVQSAWVKKKDDGIYAGLRTNNVGGNSYIIFDFDTATIVASGSDIISNGVQAYSNGWYRIYMTYTLQTTGLIYSITNSSSSVIPAYVGTGKGYYIWGAQLEAGTYPTSYIPTTSASVTRVGDSCYKTGINSILGDSGTWYLEIEPYNVNTSTSSYKKILGIFKTNAIVSDAIYLEEYNGTWSVYVRKGGSTITTTGYKTTQPTKIAVTFGASGSRIYFDGTQQAFTAVDTSNEMTQISTQANAGSPIESVLKIKNFVYYPNILSATELAALTTI
jgi:hypothetical protein